MQFRIYTMGFWLWYSQRLTSVAHWNYLDLFHKLITGIGLGATLSLFQLGVRATCISYQRQFYVTTIYILPKYTMYREVYSNPNAKAKNY